MAQEEATPRVNYEAMQRFQGRRVLLAGEIKAMGDGRLALKTSDDAEVMVISNPNSGSYDSAFVEVLGRVVDAKTIEEETHTNFGGNFDMRLYNEMVKLSTTKYADSFLG